MKNKIFIDFDTDREQQLMLSKPPEFTPTTREGVEAMLKDDLSCLTETIISIIDMAHNNEYFNRFVLKDIVIKILNDSIRPNDEIDNKDDVERGASKVITDTTT